MIFNTHTHINDDQQYFEVERILKECNEENVKKLVVIGYDVKSSLRAVELANTYEGVYAAVGIHPSDITKENNTIENLEELLSKSNKIVAIGEIGLDYHWENYPSKEVQIEWFIKQIKLANKYKLPIIIHSRDAMGDTVEVLKNNKEYYEKGIMHCYPGSTETSVELAKLGFYFSFAFVFLNFCAFQFPKADFSFLQSFCQSVLCACARSHHILCLVTELVLLPLR